MMEEYHKTSKQLVSLLSSYNRMISFLHQQSESKHSQLLQRVTDENKTLNSLDRNVLSELALPFKLQNGKIFQPSEILIKLKEKIVEICQQEKEQCTNYLLMSKFKNLSEKSTSVLRQILNQVWSQFKSEIKNFEVLGKISPLICKSDSPQDIQNFHLKNFHLVLNSTNFLQNSLVSIPPFQQQAFQSLLPPGMGIVNQRNFQTLGMQFPNNNFPVHEGVQPNIEGFQNQNYKKILPKIQEVQQFQNIPLTEDTGKKVKKLEEQSPNIEMKKIKELSSPNQNGSQAVGSKVFGYCICKGKQSTEQKHFSCDICPKKFHYSCLKISQSLEPKSQQLGRRMCPFCYVKQENIFFQILGEPLDFFWTIQKDLGNKKIVIKAKKCRQIYEKQLLVEIRLLKIIGKAFFHKSEEMEDENDKENRIGEIMLSGKMFTRDMAEDLKITFENSKIYRNDDPSSSQNTVPSLAAAYALKQLTKGQIIKNIKSFSGENFLLKFFSEGENQLKIQILNHEGNLIQTPGRGVDCSHPDVFDVEEFVSHALENQFECRCFICNEKCRGLVIDRLIANQLQKIRTELEEEPPQAIFFQKNGTFRRQNLQKNEEKAQEVPVIIGSGLNSWEVQSSEMEEEIND